MLGKASVVCEEGTNRCDPGHAYPAMLVESCLRIQAPHGEFSGSVLKSGEKQASSVSVYCGKISFFSGSGGFDKRTIPAATDTGRSGYHVGQR